MATAERCSPDRVCSEAKQLRLGYAANAVYIQHSGTPPKPLRYSVVGEVPKTWLVLVKAPIIDGLLTEN